MRVESKSRTETVRIGDVQTTMTWQGSAKKPTVTYQHVEYVIPEPMSLNSIIVEEGVEYSPEPTLNQDTLLYQGV